MSVEELVTPPEPAADGGRRARLSSVVATVVIGVSGYLVLVVTARTLPPAENAAFLVYWGLQYMVFGTLVGLTLEGTRSAFRAGRRLPQPTAGTPRIALLGGGIATGVAVLLGLTGALWAPSLLGTGWNVQLLVLCAGTVLFGMQCALSGALMGTGRTHAYSSLISSEAVARLALVVLAVWAAPSVSGFAAAAALAAGAWIVVLGVRPATRTAWTVRADAGTATQLRRMAAALLAALASAVLIVGFPVLVAATSSDVVLDGAAPLMLAISLTRAPLLVPLSIYQNVIVTHVAHSGWRALRGPLLVGLGLAVVGAPAAALLGPWALGVVRPGYTVDGWVMGGLVVAAAAAALITMTGAAAVACGQHAAYLVGWVGATGVAVALLLLPLALEERVLLALTIGPLAGACVHVVDGLAGRRRAARR